MILVDISIWVDRLRAGEAGLADALNLGQGEIHPLVIAELACGILANRSDILNLLKNPPAAQWARCTTNLVDEPSQVQLE